MTDADGAETAIGSDAERSALLSALVTEHFVLQSAAGATISESGSRASIYLAALSSGLVAIGFSSGSPGTLLVLASTVLPTVFLLGWFTVVRLIDTSIAAVVAQQRIETIRHYYGGLSAAAPRFFPADDDIAGTLGVRYGSRAFLFTTATMIAVVNSVLGGAVAGVVAALAGTATSGTATAVGVFAGVVSLGLSLGYQARRFAPVRRRTR